MNIIYNCFIEIIIIGGSIMAFIIDIIGSEFIGDIISSDIIDIIIAIGDIIIAIIDGGIMAIIGDIIGAIIIIMAIESIIIIAIEQLNCLSRWAGRGHTHGHVNVVLKIGTRAR